MKQKLRWTEGFAKKMKNGACVDRITTTEGILTCKWGSDCVQTVCRSLAHFSNLFCWNINGTVSRMRCRGFQIKCQARLLLQAEPPSSSNIRTHHPSPISSSLLFFCFVLCGFLLIALADFAHCSVHLLKRDFKHALKKNWANVVLAPKQLSECGACPEARATQLPKPNLISNMVGDQYTCTKTFGLFSWS